MPILKSIIDLAKESIGFSLILLIVAFFLGAIRPSIVPITNAITLSFYDFIILVFVGVGILSLLIKAFGGSSQPTKTERAIPRPAVMQTEMSRSEF